MRITQSVCKDDNGFIWVSSQTGVIRIAGNNCRTYQLPYEQGNFLYLRLVYRSPELIAFTNNGQVFRYNPVYDRFDLLFNMRNLLNSVHLWLKNVIIDNDEKYFLATKYGLYQYREGKLTRLSSVPEEYVIRYDNDNLCIADENGISELNIKTLQKKILYRHLPGKSSRFVVTKLFFDKTHNRLWIGTLHNGLYYYDYHTSTMVYPTIKPFSKQPILAIEANSDSTILIGIDGQGVWELNKAHLTVSAIYRENVNDPYSLSGDGIYDIFHDRRNERVWICSYTGGVSFFEQKSPLVEQITHNIANSNSLHNNSVNQILEDKEGKIWFATNNGISCWNIKNDKWTAYYQNEQEHARVFLSLCEDNEGNIWCGSYASGIYVLDGKTGNEIAHYSKGGQNAIPANDFVFSIYRDSEGDIWIGGTQNEILCYLAKQRRFKQYPYFPVSTFAELQPGKMLLACASGLFVLDKESGTYNNLTNTYLLQDVALHDNEVWMCTSGDGLLRYNPENKTIRKYTTGNGLPSNYLNSILLLDSCLWLGTESGLCCFIPEDESVRTYPSLLPVSNVSFNRIAGCRLRNGQLIFGTNKGALMFDPVKLYQIRQQGRIFIQDMIVSGHSIRDNQDFELNTPLDSLSEISLNYYQNNLTLELLPLGDETGSSKFSWKMEGHDTDWSHPSDYNRLVYTNIPNGKFVLKMRMLDNSLSQVINERSLIITVNPPFWKTGWFRLLLFILLSAIVYFSLRFYINRLKQKHTEDKVRFFTNTAHDIRTVLTLIKAPVEELNKEQNLSGLGKHYLHLATEQVRRLSVVTTQLLDFQKVDIGKGQLSWAMTDMVKLIANRRLMFESFAKSKNIELYYTFMPSVYPTAIDEAMMEKVIDNLISNAVKYSNPDSRVQILFDGSARHWTLEVKDHGIGISKKAQSKLFREFYRSENAVNSKIVGSGIGLLLAKNYVTLHGGTISCVSQENIGSCFKITVPFKEVAEKNNPVRTTESIPISGPAQPVPQEPVKKTEMHILIVEDNDDLRNFMQYPLMDTFDVQTAEDGEQAWKIIQEQMPDLVVSDIMMPNMDGFELCRRIKSTYETSHIPIVLLTALTGNAEQLHGLGLGADDYLTKPFDMPLLLQRIKSIIRNRSTIREKALKLIKRNGDETILTNELNDKFLKKALDVIHANMANENFGKNEFASAMNVSSTLLHTKIKSLTGQSPANLVRSIRLNHALELLQSQKYTVTEVSEMCGFSNIGYFSMAFKNHFGKPPTKI
jgi:signal transduction histidine kinase/ligand-binding sensor domain-containing protein/DNA-binding NarL/FixJ family response regulator